MVRWIGICDGNMEEGSLRCDANVSIRPTGSNKLGTRVEVKNLNSLKHIRHAIEIEIARLSDMMDKGETIIQETRSYDADAGITFSIRTKEDAEDYRYFPEPDLAPFKFTDEYIDAIKSSLPAMPEEKVKQYEVSFALSEYDATQLTDEKLISELFDEVASTTSHWKLLANFFLGPVRSYLNQHSLDWNELAINKMKWASLLQMVDKGKVAFSVAAQSILPVMFDDVDADPHEVAVKLNLIQDADEDQVIEWVKKTLDAMPEKVAEYRKGKKGLIGLFVGEVKKESGGKADPRLTTELLNRFLNNIN
jgi:aspartyl-tRNA(Asn)/glutamyl-tRNA(Gln) amidotransferase subunit B